MCTVITKKQKYHPKIAKEDITVFKCTRGNWNWPTEDSTTFITFFRGCVYEKDEVAVTKFKYTEDDWNVGPSDRTESKYKNKLKVDRIPFCYVQEGFHSYESIERMRMDDGPDTIKLPISGLFIIPKGARYYKNSAGNYVSDKIIFKRII